MSGDRTPNPCAWNPRSGPTPGEGRCHNSPPTERRPTLGGSRHRGRTRQVRDGTPRVTCRPTGRRSLFASSPTAGPATPDLSDFHRGRWRGRRSSHNPVGPEPGCGPPGTHTASLTRLSGSASEGCSHLAVTPWSEEWSKVRSVTRPAGLATVGRCAPCCPRSVLPRGRPKRPRISRTSPRRSIGSRGLGTRSSIGWPTRCWAALPLGSSFSRRSFRLRAFRTRRSSADPVTGTARGFLTMTGPVSPSPTTPTSRRVCPKDPHTGQ